MFSQSPFFADSIYLSHLRWRFFMSIDVESETLDHFPDARSEFHYGRPASLASLLRLRGGVASSHRARTRWAFTSRPRARCCKSSQSTITSRLTWTSMIHFLLADAGDAVESEFDGDSNGRGINSTANFLRPESRCRVQHPDNAADTLHSASHFGNGKAHAVPTNTTKVSF